MARDRIGYEAGIPLTRDIGPANGAGQSDPLGRLGALRLPALVAAGAMTAGVGPIERRQATPEERARWSARNTDIERRRVEEEHPVDTITSLLRRPCDVCLHAVVCSLRALVPEGEGDGLAISELAPGLRLIAERVRVVCDHFLAEGATVAAVAHPTDAGRAQASRERGTSAMLARRTAEPLADSAQARAERARKVRAALEAHPDDMAAARAMTGLRGPAFAMVVRSLRAKGELSAAVPD